MSRPDDIPAEVWETAQAVESDCINATWNGTAKGTRTISETIIARAIMAAKAEAMSDWRDIGTAPKDGSDMLLAIHKFNDPAQGQIVVFGYWDHGQWMPVRSGDCDELYPPTHWMPIPTPPVPTPMQEEDA